MTAVFCLFKKCKFTNGSLSLTNNVDIIDRKLVGGNLMDVLIDGQHFLKTNQLDELNIKLNQWIKKYPNRAVYGYEWEHQHYEEDWLTFLTSMISQDIKVNLLTKSKSEVKQDLKLSIESYCIQLKEFLPNVIEKLYGISPYEDGAQLVQLFEGIDFLISGVNILSLDIDLDDRNEAVKELLFAYEAKDYVEFADLLKYQWLPWINGYLSMVQNLYMEM